MSPQSKPKSANKTVQRRDKSLNLNMDMLSDIVSKNYCINDDLGDYMDR